MCVLNHCTNAYVYVIIENMYSKVCKQKFVEKTLMETHYFEEHVMHCLVCKKPFSNKGNLNRHMKQAHGQELPADYKEPTVGKSPMKQAAHAVGKSTAKQGMHTMGKSPIKQ